MSTHIPGRHIDGMVKRFANADAILPPGWTREAWQSYQDDPDGARAVCRAIHRDNDDPRDIDMDDPEVLEEVNNPDTREVDS